MTRQTEVVKSPLRRLREARDMSREGLADRAGVSLRAIERIEAGTVTPRRATLAVLAAVLEVTPDELREAA